MTEGTTIMAAKQLDTKGSSNSTPKVLDPKITQTYPLAYNIFRQTC